MFQPDQIALSGRLAAIELPSVGTHRCLVLGCSCRATRAVPRRAAFLPVVARRRNLAAGSAIAPEPGWRLVAALRA